MTDQPPPPPTAEQHLQEADWLLGQVTWDEDNLERAEVLLAALTHALMALTKRIGDSVG